MLHTFIDDNFEELFLKAYTDNNHGLQRMLAAFSVRRYVACIENLV